MKRFISIMLVLSMVFGMSTSVFAGTDGYQESPNVIKNEAQIVLHVNSNDPWQEKVNRLLADGNYELVTVLFDDFADDSLNNESSLNLMQPNSLGPVKTKYVKNPRNANDYIGKTIIAKSRGEVGTTCSIDVVKSVSTTLNNSFSCPVHLITAAVGWSVTGSTSITIGGSKEVPKTHNGKKVTHGTLNATIIYKVKEFDVWFGIQGTNMEEKLGVGNTKKAYGVNFYMTYEYK